MMPATETAGQSLEEERLGEKATISRFPVDRIESQIYKYSETLRNSSENLDSG